MKAAIIKLLTENARFSLQDIAARLGITAAEADKIIKELEADKVICGYTAILNENELAENYVRALIEVKVTPLVYHLTHSFHNLLSLKRQQKTTSQSEK